MAELGTITGAIMSQLGKGRSQADLAVLELAKRYKEYDAGDGQHLLADFPIPRFSLDEVVVDLKLVISETPVSENFISPETKTRIISQVENMVRNLPNEQPSFVNLGVESPQVVSAWANEQNDVIQKISSLIPDEVEIMPNILAQNIATIVRERMTRTVISRDANIPVSSAWTFVEKSVPVIETELTTRVSNIITDELKSQPIRTDRLSVLVTASELDKVAPERITTLRLTFHEADRTWTRYEVEDGRPKEKLIPR